jgi:hypothetical protein
MAMKQSTLGPKRQVERESLRPQAIRFEGPRVVAQRRQIGALFGAGHLPDASSGTGAPMQRVRRLLPPANYSVAVNDDGFNRLKVLQLLLDGVPALMAQLSEARDYEPIFKKVLGWREGLMVRAKAAQRWLEENTPKNKHQPVMVPDGIYLDLAEAFIGYRRELNDSYQALRTVIENERAELEEKHRKPEEEQEEDDDWENPLSVPKMLYRWVSTAEAKRAIKEGILFSGEGGGIPTSTKPGIGIAITSGAVALDCCLAIDPGKIPGFRFEYVPTRSKLKEVKIKCDVPAEAISRS